MLLKKWISHIANQFLDTKKKYQKPIPDNWETILVENVDFYRKLKKDEKQIFKQRMLHFLNTTKITGIKCKVEEIDKILIAASAIIPIYNFPNWEYINLDEVLLYPKMFDNEFNIEGDQRNITGMVGSGGVMDNKMILSKPSLMLGFKNESDKKNVAIHEFVHLVDKADGEIDGIPKVLMEQQYMIPWLNLAREKINEIIDERNHDIRDYATYNKAEFFSVVSEYFFERPDMLKRKHPKLYEMLDYFFSTKSV